MKNCCFTVRNVLETSEKLHQFVFQIKHGSMWKWDCCLWDRASCLLLFSLCFFHLLPSVFPEDSDADCEAHHPYKHTLHTAGLTDTHGGCLPHQPTNHDDHGTHAFPLPTGCTVLHPTGDTDAVKHVLKWHLVCTSVTAPVVSESISLILIDLNIRINLWCLITENMFLKGLKE